MQSPHSSPSPPCPPPHSIETQEGRESISWALLSLITSIDPEIDTVLGRSVCHMLKSCVKKKTPNLKGKLSQNFQPGCGIWIRQSTAAKRNCQSRTLPWRGSLNLWPLFYSQPKEHPRPPTIIPSEKEVEKEVALSRSCLGHSLRGTMGRVSS